MAPADAPLGGTAIPPRTDLVAGDGRGQPRDIDLVLVTGAGASTEFGVNGTKLPLMAEWSDSLVSKLAQRINYLDTTGLRRGMSGEEFETRLGKFLRDIEAFGRIGDLLEASARFQDLGPGGQALTAQGVLPRWHSVAVHHFDQIVGLIRESLYENFADASVDLGAAGQAYSGLFGSLGLSGDSRMVYATTNYDTIGENAIRASGGRPDWGQPPSLGNEGELRLEIPGIIEGIGRYVPVLHLHGRVGWYRRDGRVYAANVVRHEQGYGIPIVMLPDPDKVYDQDDVIISLWQQFGEALARAKRVLVLGHSLNDSFMLRALVQNVEPLERIAVAVLEAEGDDGQAHESAAPVLEKIRQHLGNAAIIPMRFGSSPDAGRPGISIWTEKLEGGGLL
jgi:hypothetical protein